MPAPGLTAQVVRVGVALVSVAFVVVEADLPVHCLHHQVLGDWSFFLGPLGPKRKSCGHLRPDNEDYQPLVRLKSVDRELQVTLQHPNIARSSTDKDGHWTMIYDEGFEVNVEGLSFFAFSRFDLVWTGETKQNTSRCGETQLGWYHTIDRKQWGCYHATKSTNGEAHHKLGLVSHVPSRPTKTTGYDQPLDDDYHSSVVDKLNTAQEHWRAKAHPWYSGKSLREMNTMAGLYRSLPVSAQKGMHAGVRKTPATFLQMQSSSQLTVTAWREVLPTAWDWRNVSGVNYVDVVRDQGDCGSCYVVATIHMLSARNRIRRGNASLERFSIGFPLYCSEYNQGCEGGYAFLASKWSHDVGLVPSSCHDDSPRCLLRCDPQKLPQQHRAANYHYVGGYYGGSSEHEIMRELVHGGPLVASLEPQNDLMYYSGGVYKHFAHLIPHSEWEQVDHAVLLVGFGEEHRQKYWILQNSWGTEWGEGGYFRMVRGTDECGIESLVVAADVVEDDLPSVLFQFAAHGVLV